LSWPPDKRCALRSGCETQNHLAASSQGGWHLIHSLTQAQADTPQGLLGVIVLVVFQNIWVTAHLSTPQDKPAFPPGLDPTRKTRRGREFTSYWKLLKGCWVKDRGCTRSSSPFQISLVSEMRIILECTLAQHLWQKVLLLENKRWHPTLQIRTLTEDPEHESNHPLRQK
jgi:hypothetical protein